mgnify:FL=1
MTKIYKFHRIYVDENLKEQLLAVKDIYPDLLHQMEIVDNFWRMDDLEKWKLFTFSQIPEDTIEGVYRQAHLTKILEAMFYMKKAEYYLQKKGFPGLRQHIHIEVIKKDWASSYAKKVNGDPYCNWTFQILRDLIRYIKNLPPGDFKKWLIRRYCLKKIAPKNKILSPDSQMLMIDRISLDLDIYDRINTFINHNPFSK